MWTPQREDLSARGEVFGQGEDLFSVTIHMGEDAVEMPVCGKAWEPTWLVSAKQKSPNSAKLKCRLPFLSRCPERRALGG
jgi:hypothetical protein